MLVGLDRMDAVVEPVEFDKMGAAAVYCIGAVFAAGIDTAAYIVTCIVLSAVHQW